jgi:hypothetical protein
MFSGVTLKILILLGSQGGFNGYALDRRASFVRIADLNALSVRLLQSFFSNAQLAALKKFSSRQP